MHYHNWVEHRLFYSEIYLCIFLVLLKCYNLVYLIIILLYLKFGLILVVI